MSRNDGGPAFPVEMLSGGMSLRDYFAAAATTGLLSNGGGTDWEDCAKTAYRIADALLVAKEEP